MPKIYSIDGAIKKNRPYIQLRGRLYHVRDITMRERLQKIDEFKKKQAEAEAETGKDEADITFEDVQKVIAEAVKNLLVDVPDEVADGITEMEWEILQQTMGEIQRSSFPVEVQEVKEDEIDENLVGPAVG